MNENSFDLGFMEGYVEGLKDVRCKFCSGTGLEAVNKRCRVCKGKAFVEFIEVSNHEIR